MTHEERARRVLEELGAIGMVGGHGKAHPFGCCGAGPALLQCAYHSPRAIALLAKEFERVERDAQDVAASATRKRGSL